MILSLPDWADKLIVERATDGDHLNMFQLPSEPSPHALIEGWRQEAAPVVGDCSLKQLAYICSGNPDVTEGSPVDWLAAALIDTGVPRLQLIMDMASHSSNADVLAVYRGWRQRHQHILMSFTCIQPCEWYAATWLGWFECMLRPMNMVFQKGGKHTSSSDQGAQIIFDIRSEGQQKELVCSMLRSHVILTAPLPMQPRNADSLGRLAGALKGLSGWTGKSADEVLQWATGRADLTVSQIEGLSEVM